MNIKSFIVIIGSGVVFSGYGMSSLEVTSPREVSCALCPSPELFYKDALFKEELNFREAYKNKYGKKENKAPQKKRCSRCAKVPCHESAVDASLSALIQNICGQRLIEGSFLVCDVFAIFRCY